MSKIGFDLFKFCKNFISEYWMPKHVIIGLFEAIDTTRLALAKLEVKLFIVKF
jgi:hypothetical protein